MEDILFWQCHYYALSVMYPQAFKKGDDLFVQRRELLASYVVFLSLSKITSASVMQGMSIGELGPNYICLCCYRSYTEKRN